MFARMYEKLTHVGYSHGNAVTVRPTSVCVNVIAHVYIGILGITLFVLLNGVLYKSEMEISTWATVMAFGAVWPVVSLLYLLLRLVDNVIWFCIEYMTDGEHVPINYLEGKLFRATVPFNDGLGLVRYSAFCIPLMILSYLSIILIGFPVIIPYVIGILVVVGLVWGMLFMGRLAFRISKKLDRHAADPDAHKRRSGV